jgi:hypothetical protein
MRWIERALRRRATVFTMAVAPAATLASVDGSHISNLPQAPGPRGERTVEQAEIEHQPICVGSSVMSAGALSDTLYYRAVETPDGKVKVGYFAFWSEERPWGNNWLTWSVFPALAVDLVYSRALLVAPGLQRYLYGAGDVEGVGVSYDRAPDGSLHVTHADADDGTHDYVALSKGDVFAIDPERPTFYSRAWSHQLGGQGAGSRSDLAYVHCYDENSIRPLPMSVASEFKVDGDNRAPPAHVEREVGARRLDARENEGVAVSVPAPPRG